jgi:1,4-alpha-glucan branching enzyme
MIQQTVSRQELDRIVNLEEHNPIAILGPKIIKKAGEQIFSIRAYLPRAVKAWVTLNQNLKKTMDLIDSRGFYEAQVDLKYSKSKYLLSFEDKSGFVSTSEDTYSFSPMITDYDIYLFAEGTHRRSYEILGTHQVEVEGVSGIRFATWAPNARSVCLIGNFNHWTIGENPMNSRGSSGIWELFIPRLKESEVYKFAIKSNITGLIMQKTDPYAFKTELRPRTGAVVSNLESYKWRDDEWMTKRSNVQAQNKPISVYEVHLGSWRKKIIDGSDQFLSYRELADLLITYVKDLKFTHIELLPIMEHPLDDSWGYQVVNYFAPTSRYGNPSDFMYFVDECHRQGIGVILDWVPAHFPKDEYGLALFDGTHLFNHADRRIGEFLEWGTYAFNYSRNEVRSFLISNANFWMEKYHIDGLRIDAVASMLYLDYSRKPGEWIPNEYGGRENLAAISFLRQLNEAVHEDHSGILMIAEESTAWPKVTGLVRYGGLGFDLKWNMGWMHDTLLYFSKDPVFRKYHQNNLTFSILYAFSEQFILVLSHDEVVYGKGSLLNKMPGDQWQKLANLRLCLGYMFTHPGKKLLFMGAEIAQWNEWNFRTSLDWHLLQYPEHSSIQRYVKDLNRLYDLDELHELDFSYDGFEWIDFGDVDQSVISYIRKSKNPDEFVVVVLNMTSVPRYNYRIGVPCDGYYKEILNGDGVEYGGSGVGNLGGVRSEPLPAHQKNHSVNLTLPPLGMLVLKYTKIES